MAVISKYKDERGEKPGLDALARPYCSTHKTNKSTFSWMHLEFPTGSLFNSLKSFLSFCLLIYYEEEVETVAWYLLAFLRSRAV